MEIKDVKKGAVMLIVAVVLLVIMLAVGLDEFLEPPQFIVLWACIGVGATGLGYLVAFMIDLFTGKDPRSWVLPVFPLFLAGLTGIAIMIEGRSFMGNIGQAVIFFFATMPLLITAVIWTIVSIVRTVKKMSALEKEVGELKAAQNK